MAQRQHAEGNSRVQSQRNAPPTVLQSVHVYDHVVEHRHYHVYCPTSEEQSPAAPSQSEHAPGPVSVERRQPPSGLLSRLARSTPILAHSRNGNAAPLSPQLPRTNSLPNHSFYGHLNYSALQQRLQQCRTREGMTSIRRVGAQISMPSDVPVAASKQNDSCNGTGYAASNGQACLPAANAGEAGTSTTVAASLENIPEKAMTFSREEVELCNPPMDIPSDGRKKHLVVNTEEEVKTQDGSSRHSSASEPTSPTSLASPLSPTSAMTKKRVTVSLNLGKELASLAGSVRQAYKAFDADGDGNMTLQQFTDGLERLRIEPEQTLVLRRGVDNVFQMLDIAGTGVVNIREILSIESTEDPKHMETSELWRKVLDSEKQAKLKGRSRKAEQTPADEGEARIQEIDAANEQLRLRKGIQRHWENVRAEPQRHSQPAFDPRLHREVNALLMGKAPEVDAAICEKLAMDKRVHRIRDGLNHCSSSRHQVVELQRMLKPPEPDREIFRALHGSFLVSAESTRPSGQSLVESARVRER